METNVLVQGLILMAAGMGAVYVFLLILIAVMNVAAKVVPKLGFMLPDPAPAAPPAPARTAGDDAEVAVAIAAAMRKRRG